MKKLIWSFIFIATIFLFHHFVKPKKHLTAIKINRFQHLRSEFDKKRLVKIKKRNGNSKNLLTTMALKKGNKDKKNNELHTAMEICSNFDSTEKYFLEKCDTIERMDTLKINNFLDHNAEELRVARNYVEDMLYDIYTNFTYLFNLDNSDDQNYNEFKNNFSKIYPLFMLVSLENEFNSDQKWSEIDPFQIVDKLNFFNQKIEEKIKLGTKLDFLINILHK